MNTSLQKQLQQRQINLEGTLQLISDSADNLCVDWIDLNLCERFFRQCKNAKGLPPVIPLLLWQSCYYLGSPSEWSPGLIDTFGQSIGPDPGLISDALLGVVVWRTCPHCAEPHPLSADELAALGLTREDVVSRKTKKGRGCSQCFESGYSGREAIIELLNVDSRVRQIIYDGSMTQLNHYLQSINYQFFQQAVIDKVLTGVTTVEEVKRVLPSSALMVRAPYPSHREAMGFKVI